MNDQNKYLKMLFLLAFVAFASVSCWATAESLHMLLDGWPIIFCYVVTIGFFIIASIGTKLIADSFNNNVYVENRKSKFWFGLLITLIFWLICSMPTNTHTFFYRSVVNGVAQGDMQNTIGYLNQLTNDTKIEEQINVKCTELDNAVEAKLTDLETEIKNSANPGFGPKSEDILRQFASLLDVPKVDPISYKSTSEQQRKKLIDMYREKIYALRDTKKAAIRASMTATNKSEYHKKAKAAAKNIEEYQNALNQNPKLMHNVKNVHDLDSRLLAGYACIKTYNKFVSFDPDNDKEKYTAEHPVTDVKRVLSVVDVWKDMFKGKYKGHGFIFWVLISVLVDVAAFIFFDLTFKKRD